MSWKGDERPSRIGPIGPQGPCGVQGKEGPCGVQGSKGETGCEGKEGKAGTKGIPGGEGKEGPKGPIGSQGLKGETGNVGPQGTSWTPNYVTAAVVAGALPTGLQALATTGTIGIGTWLIHAVAYVEPILVGYVSLNINILDGVCTWAPAQPRGILGLPVAGANGQACAHLVGIATVSTAGAMILWAGASTPATKVSGALVCLQI